MNTEEEKQPFPKEVVMVIDSICNRGRDVKDLFEYPKVDLHPDTLTKFVTEKGQEQFRRNKITRKKFLCEFTGKYSTEKYDNGESFNEIDIEYPNGDGLALLNEIEGAGIVLSVFANNEDGSKNNSLSYMYELRHSDYLDNRNKYPIVKRTYIHSPELLNGVEYQGTTDVTEPSEIEYVDSIIGIHLNEIESLLNEVYKEHSEKF